MADATTVDIALGDLSEVTTIGDTDMFAMEQNSVVYRISGATIKAWLYKVSQAHGMIKSIDLVGSSGLVDTYRITLADWTTKDYTVENGNGVKSIVAYYGRTNSGVTPPQSWGTDILVPSSTLKYLWEHFVITYTNGDVVTTQNHVCSVYGDKGDKGDKGDPPQLEASITEYQVGTSGKDAPTGEWSTTIPTVPQGLYLWAKTTVTFETGDPVVFYGVSRMGVDGSGSVVSVNDKSPDASGNVALSSEDVGATPADHEGDRENPHSVTKAQVGLGNVPNVATNDQTPTYTAATALTALTSGEKLSVAFGKIAKAVTDLISHIANKANPHGVTAAQAGAATASHNHSGSSILPASIELTPGTSAGHGGFIDFHYNGSTADYTSRIIEASKGVVTLNGKKIMTSANITAVYGVAITFASGKATYENSAILATSVVIVQRRSGTVGALGVFATSGGTAGKVTIIFDNTADSYTANVNILIINTL